MAEHQHEPTLTMQDIADLAQVHRPVVSMWRKRPVARGEFVPFPAPVATVDRVERFRRDEVIDWLERTGRGNNTAHRLDAPALSVPDGVEFEHLVTLLCLAAASGRELAGLSGAELTALATDVDPGDTMLVAEVGTVPIEPKVLAYIDDLIESAFGLADALERLETGRAGRALEARDLSESGLSLLRCIVETCLEFQDSDTSCLVSDGDLPRLVLDLIGDRADLTVVGNDARARGLRRRATIREARVVDQAAAPAVRLMSVIGDDPAPALDRVDDVLVALEPGEVAIVVGPASVLCEKLGRDLEPRRSGTVRLGGVAMALRLPRGLWRDAHRQAMGVWIVRGGADIEQPLVSDLGAPAAGALDLEALAADIVGALTSSARRAYRYGRPRRRSDILAGGAMVPQGICADRLRVTDATHDIDRVRAATVLTARPVEPLDVLVVPAKGTVQVRHWSLSELAERKLVRMLRGSRIDPAHACDGATVPVLAADHSTDGMTLDPLDAERYYSRAVRTRPGDVIFAERPRPLAWVDETGGALVASPSRILRLDLDAEAGVGPRALAALINQMPAQGREWKAWSVPWLGRSETSELEDTLGRAAVYESEMRARLTATSQLCAALIHGIANGTVSLRAPEQVVV
ncbi:helix-turn-helix transcriptional regulator [Nocardia sp. NPDC004415]